MKTQRIAGVDVPIAESLDELTALLANTGFGGAPDRPYDGQPWTWCGVRGKPSLPTMTFRDLGDKIVRALETFPGLDHVDTTALAQNVLLQIEEETKR